MFFFFTKSIIQIHNRLEVSLSVCLSVSIHPPVLTVSFPLEYSQRIQCSSARESFVQSIVSITEEYRVSNTSL